LREVDQLDNVLRCGEDELPPELRPYYEAVLGLQAELRRQVTQNLEYLDGGPDAILPELLSNTQATTRSFAFHNHMFVRPVLRAKPSDRLCLKMLGWLHSVHPQTKDIPVALSDEEVSVIPFNPAIYFMPCSVQHGLLYLPLFFHELGHLLYALHRSEMDDLVQDLQKRLERLLTPSIRRNDEYGQEEDRQRGAIVETWYEWAQELFCDAVGYSIGGTSFACAISMYLRMRGPDQYQVPLELLENRSHPVAWLRVRILADRARRMGRDEDAGYLEDAWDKIGVSMGIAEDYYGFYDDSFLGPIQEAIDDMLVEAAPRSFREEELAPVATGVPPNSPVHLLNLAWKQFLDDPDGYRGWEKSLVDDFLEGKVPG
jgi:hypothetical protein